jgi:hypothetical protein
MTGAAQASSPKMLFDEPAESIQIAHLMHRRAESGEVGHEFSKVTTGAWQAPQGDLQPVVAKFSFDQLKKDLAAFARQRRTNAGVALKQSPRLPEDPGIAETAPADGNTVRARLA